MRQNPHRHHRHHLHHTRHKNLIFLILSVILALFLARQPWFIAFLHSLGGLGYVGAFLAGVFFVSTFTLPTSVIFLSVLNNYLTLPEICLFAALGALVGDFIMFHTVKNELEEELKPVEKYVEGTHLWKLLHTRHFRWTLPVIGALLIVTPLPNELGVSLLRLARMPTPEFVIVSFVLNILGILTLSLATRLVF